MKIINKNITDTEHSHNEISNIELSFEGSLWKCAFYIGVYKALIELYGYDQIKNIKVAGTSSGVLAALAITIGYKWEDLDRLYRLIAKYSNEYGNYGITSLYLDIFLDKMLKNDDDYKKLNGKLFIGVTKFFKKSYIVSEWTSNEDLKNTIRESTNIPFYICRNINTFTIDGCLSGGFIKLSKNTLFITANENKAHINPSIKFSYFDSIYTLQDPLYSISIDDGYNVTKNFFKIFNKSEKKIINIDIVPMGHSITLVIWSLYLWRTYWKYILLTSGISILLLNFFVLK